MLHTYNTQEANRCANDFENELRLQLKRQIDPAQWTTRIVGFDTVRRDQLAMPTTIAVREVQEGLKEIKQAKLDVTLEAVSTCVALNSNEQAIVLGKRQRDEALTLEEEHREKRTVMDQLYGSTRVIDKPFVAKYGDPKMMEKAQRFQRLCGGLTEAIREERRQAVGNLTMEKAQRFQRLCGGLTETIREERRQAVGNFTCHSQQHVDQDAYALKLLHKFVGIDITRELPH